MRSLATISAVVPTLLCGCLSRDLVEWAGEDVATGSLRRVVRSQTGPDAVLYELVTKSGEHESRAFLVPGDWRDLPRTSWTSEKGGVLVGLADPIPCSLVQSAEGVASKFLWIDYRLTLGYAVTPHDVGRTPRDALLAPTIYGIARFNLEQDGVPHEIHELYGYDPIDYRWVRMGAVDLGPYRGNVPAMVTATVLFLPALAVDIAGTLLLVFIAVDDPGTASSFDGVYSGFYAPPPEPPDMRQRAIPDLDG